ncbi:MAG: AAA family ATPase [Pirellulales bacterium]|nr:AAA family ATPase [Pirellulales bacterium]
MNSELLDRPPPHDLAAERQLIGSILLEPDRLDDVQSLLRPNDFHVEAHRLIYGHFLALRNGGGGAIDATLLFDRLQSTGDLEAVGGANGEAAAVLAECVHSVATAENAAYYAKIIRGKADLRRVIHTATGILQDAYNGVQPAVLRQRLESAMAKIDADAGIDFAPMTLAELMQRDVTVEYLIENLLVAAQPILLAGPVKSLKTSILLDLCLALAMGGHFLGYFRVQRSIAVGVMTGESGLPTIKDTLARIGLAAGTNPAGITRLIVSDRIPHLSNPAHLDAIKKLILDYELELLAIDPAYLALDGTDAANVMVFGQQLRAVSELCQQMGVALLLCHHTRKGSGIDGQPLELTDAAWAGFAEHCRQWLLINHREKYDQENGTARLWLKGGGSAGHGGQWAVDIHQGRLSDLGGRVWEVSVLTPDEAYDAVADQREAEREAIQQKKLERDKKVVVDAVAKFKIGETAGTLRTRTGMSGTRFNIAIAAALNEGMVVECEVTKPNRKKPYPAYKLAE